MTLLQALSKFTTSLKVDHRDRSPARMWLGRVKRGTSDRFNCEPPLVTVYASSNLPRFFFFYSDVGSCTCTTTRMLIRAFFFATLLSASWNSPINALRYELC